MARFGKVPLDPAVRFWAKVDTSGEDWFWLGHIDRHGYGRFGVGSRSDGSRTVTLAHRFVYELVVGPIPDGMTIDHLCRVRACVRPDHLEVVSNEVNVQRGMAGAHWLAKTHCPQGHRYTPENTYLRPAKRPGARRRRVCRACSLAASRTYYRSRHAA